MNSNFVWYNNHMMSLILGYFKEKERIIISTRVNTYWKNVLVTCERLNIPDDITETGLHQLLKCVKTIRICDVQISTSQQLEQIILTLPNIQILSITYYKKNTTTIQDLYNIANLKKLERLYFYYYDGVMDEGLQYISTLKNLQHLYFYRCDKMTDKGSQHISKIKNLEQLCIIRCNKITSEGLKHLSTLTTLRQLNISGCSKIKNKGLYITYPHCHHYKNLTLAIVIK